MRKAAPTRVCVESDLGRAAINTLDGLSRLFSRQCRARCWHYNGGPGSGSASLP